ncbi:MAG: DUF721 domain-containing protein [Candidatus Obscuribacterales bacterium]|nr:DUF721 domain-containing protein [Candidatus Obscuribacterales bacterium]
MTEQNDDLKKSLASLRAQSKRRQESGRKANANMQQVEKVLPSVLAQLGLEKRLREHAIMQVWTSLLPAALAKRCRPLFIDHQNSLVVAVSDAAVAQELSLVKSKLLQSLSATARSIGMEVKALRVDMKNFHRHEIAEIEEPKPLPKPELEELHALQLSINDMRLIGELSKALDESGSEYKAKIMSTYETQLRLLEWRRRHDYPICQSCGNPVSRRFDKGGHKLCFNCFARD